MIIEDPGLAHHSLAHIQTVIMSICILKFLIYCMVPAFRAWATVETHMEDVVYWTEFIDDQTDVSSTPSLPSPDLQNLESSVENEQPSHVNVSTLPSFFLVFPFFFGVVGPLETILPTVFL